MPLTPLPPTSAPPSASACSVTGLWAGRTRTPCTASGTCSGPRPPGPSSSPSPAARQAGVAEAATRYGYGSYTTDWHDLVASPAVDVFDNVTTDAAHVEPTLAAIAAGKHVICEKPLASTAADCARLYEAATAAGVKHLVCFNYRFFPAVRLAWELVHGGELGELYQARFRYSQEWRTAPGAAAQRRRGAGHHRLPRRGPGPLPVRGDHLRPGRHIEPGDHPGPPLPGRAHRPGRRRGHGRPFRQRPGRHHRRLAGRRRAGATTWPGSSTARWAAWPGAWRSPNILKVYRRNGGRTAGFTEVITCEADHPLVAPWWPSGHVLGWEHGHANMLAHFIDAVAGDKEVAPFGATFLDGVAGRPGGRGGRRVGRDGRPGGGGARPGAGG